MCSRRSMRSWPSPKRWRARSRDEAPNASAPPCAPLAKGEADRAGNARSVREPWRIGSRFRASRARAEREKLGKAGPRRPSAASILLGRSNVRVAAVFAPVSPCWSRRAAISNGGFRCALLYGGTRTFCPSTRLAVRHRPRASRNTSLAPLSPMTLPCTSAPTKASPASPHVSSSRSRATARVRLRCR